MNINSRNDRACQRERESRSATRVPHCAAKRILGHRKWLLSGARSLDTPPCCGGCTLNGIRLTTGPPLLRLQGGRISQDRSCGEVGQCCRNTARLNSNGRMGIWGLTLVRLHQQASEPYLAIAAISRAAGPSCPGGSPDSCSGSPPINDGL